MRPHAEGLTGTYYPSNGDSGGMLPETRKRMIIHYTYRNPVGDVYRARVDNVASWAYEPYPPGGSLLVMRDAEGRILAGPLASELVSWACQFTGRG